METKIYPYKLTLIKFKNMNKLSIENNYTNITEFKKIISENDDIDLELNIFIGNYKNNTDLNTIFKKISINSSYDTITEAEIQTLNKYFDMDFLNTYPLDFYAKVTFIPYLLDANTSIDFFKKLTYFYLNILPKHQYLFCFNTANESLLNNLKKLIFFKQTNNKTLGKNIDYNESDLDDPDIEDHLKKYLFMTSVSHEFLDKNKLKLFIESRFYDLSMLDLNINILDYTLSQPKKNLYMFDSVEENELFMYDFNNLKSLENNSLLTSFNWDIFTKIYFPYIERQITYDKQDINLEIEENNAITDKLLFNTKTDLFLEESINVLKFNYQLNTEELDLLQIFNMVELDKSLPFVKFYSDLSGEQVYKLFKSDDTSMISKDKLKNWIKFNDFKYENYNIIPTKKKYQLIYKLFINKTKTENMINGVIINIIEENGKKYFTVRTDNDKKMIIDESNIDNIDIDTLEINNLVNFFEYSDNYLHVNFNKNNIQFTVSNDICGNDIKLKISKIINNFIDKISGVISENKLLTNIPSETLNFFTNQYFTLNNNYSLYIINSSLCLSLNSHIQLDKLLIAKILKNFDRIFTIEYENFYDSDNNKYFDIEYYNGTKWVFANILEKKNDYTYEISIKVTNGVQKKTVNEINIKKKDMIKQFYKILYEPNKKIEIKFKKSSKRSERQDIYIINISTTQEYLLIKDFLLNILGIYHSNKDTFFEIFQKKPDKLIGTDSSETTSSIDAPVQPSLNYDDDDDDLWNSSDDSDDEQSDPLADISDGELSHSSEEDEEDDYDINIIENEEIGYYDNFEDNSILARLYKYEPLFSDEIVNYPRLVQGESQPKILTDIEKKERYESNVNDCITVFNKKKQNTDHFCIECSKSKIFVKGKNDTFFCKLLKFNNNWFLCPNVWDFKENVSLDENELEFLPLGSYLNNLNISDEKRKQIGKALYGKNYKKTSFTNRQMQLKLKTIEQLEFYIEFFLDSKIQSNKVDFKNDELYKYILIFIIISKEINIQSQKPNRSDGFHISIKELLNLDNNDLKKMIKLPKYTIESNIFEQFQLNADKEFFNNLSLKTDDIVWRYHILNKKEIININNYGLNSEQISFIKEYVDLSNINIDVLEFSPRTRTDNRTFFKGKLSSNERSLYFTKKNLIYPQFHKSKLPNCAKMAHNNLDKYYELIYNTQFETGRYLKNEENRLDNQRISILTSDTLVNFFGGLKCISGQIKDTECFFRKGVDDINNNSFLYAILDVINTFNKNKKIMYYIHDLINFMLQNITYKSFQSFNNGTLEIMFRDRLGRFLPTDSLQNYLEYIVSDQYKKHDFFTDFFSSEIFINKFFSKQTLKLLIIIIEKKPDGTFKIIYPMKNIIEPTKFIFILKTDNYYEPIYFTPNNDVEHISVIDKDTNSLFTKHTLKKRLIRGYDKILTKQNRILPKNDIDFNTIVSNPEIQKHYQIKKLYFVDNYNKITYIVIQDINSSQYLIIPIKPYPFLISDPDSTIVITDFKELEKHTNTLEITIKNFNNFLKLLNKEDLQLINNSRLYVYNENNDIIALKLPYSNSEIPILHSPIDKGIETTKKKYSDNLINNKLNAYQQFINEFDYFKNKSIYAEIKTIFQGKIEKYINDSKHYLIGNYKGSNICIQIKQPIETDESVDYVSLPDSNNGLTQIMTDNQNNDENNIRIIINYIDACNEISNQYDNIINIRPFRFLIDCNEIVGIYLENNTVVLFHNRVSITLRKDYNYLLSYINYQFYKDLYKNIESHYEINDKFLDQRIIDTKLIEYKNIIYRLFKKTIQYFLHLDKNNSILEKLYLLINDKNIFYVNKFRKIYKLLESIFYTSVNKLVISNDKYKEEIIKINLKDIDDICIKKTTCSENCFFDEHLKLCKMNIILSDSKEQPDFLEMLKYNIVAALIRNSIIQREFRDNSELDINKSEFILKKNEIIFKDTDMTVDFINDLYTKKYDFYNNYGIYDLDEQSTYILDTPNIKIREIKAVFGKDKQKKKKLYFKLKKKYEDDPTRKQTIERYYQSKK